MQQINFIQGSPEWLEHRRKYQNASDCPAMLGESSYMTRDELIHQIATGLVKEVDKFTQQRFDDGHRFEALDRQIAEEVVGEALYPVTGVEGTYSASFDGLTMNEDVVYEHKTLNASIRKCDMAGDLPIIYRAQMEHQMMVSGAEKVLFRATKWDGDNLVEHKQFWYTGSSALRERIVKGWAQLAIDIENYVPPAAVKEKPKAEVAEAFPIVSILAEGKLVTCNLDEITPRFDKFLSETNTTLATDEDFVQGEADAKTSREAAKTLLLTAKAVINQMLPVSDAVSQLESYAAKFNALGLQLEKAVKDQKESIKAQAIMAARTTYTEHCTSLAAEILPISVSWNTPDFAGSIKGLKTLSSMQSAINAALAEGKIQANDIAKDLRDKLVWHKMHSKGHELLFADLQQIVFKPREDFELIVKTRIKEYVDQQEALKNQVKPEPETSAPAMTATDVINAVAPAAIAEAFSPGKGSPAKANTKPTREAMVTVLANHFGVFESEVISWLSMDFGPDQRF